MFSALRDLNPVRLEAVLDGRYARRERALVVEIFGADRFALSGDLEPFEDVQQYDFLVGGRSGEVSDDVRRCSGPSFVVVDRNEYPIDAAR